MISIQNLSLKNSNITLVKDLNVTLLQGACLNIFGENGSGKSTLLKYLANLIPIRKGNLFFDDQDVCNHLQEYRGMFEYCGHKLGLKDDLSVMQNLEFWAKIYGNQILLPAAIRTLDLESIIDLKGIKLSAGQRKRAALAKLILGNKKIWYLDEPFANLDPKYIERFINILKSRTEQSGIVILTSHAPIKDKFVQNLNLLDFKGVCDE